MEEVELMKKKKPKKSVPDICDNTYYCEQLGSIGTGTKRKLN